MKRAHRVPYVYGLATHIGKKQQNEDRAWLRLGIAPSGQPYGAAIVADGMGGLQEGAIASELVVQDFKRWLDHELDPMWRERNPFGRIGTGLYNFCFEAQRMLQLEQQKRGHHMGTTMSIVFLCDGDYAIVHIGDSRVYQMSLDTVLLAQLTEDHAWVAAQLRDGLLSREEARTHPKRNVLLQCIGMEGTIQPFLRTGKYGANDLFLLSTDGFHHAFAEEELQGHTELACRTSNKYQAISEKLIHKAYQAGAADNLTLLMIGPSRKTGSAFEKMLLRIRMKRGGC
ncbi:protein phosphatase 2C domain-containing protein [Paenibacillus sp. UMB4589-SE434]|uniref:PP2C family protein-serine/threonine phosphatase n=1 Tax=Paenibacillus sp. UMB4589-SE434 TaxID=3046314 RepID=UPI00254D9300|nr:protein phosphatase 2C domain-containing protein [Paenibacillus sp. UMB4589-SE434]MDK8181848.1 protein phosphatase 2C domain-containing protein [Paenibacillus sp. UMB4589-SE434]